MSDYDDSLYPRTLAALVGGDGDELQWQRVFLFFVATWAAFNIPLPSVTPIVLLRSFSYPAAFLLANLVALWIGRNLTLNAFLAALLYAAITVVPQLVHSPDYSPTPLRIAQGAAYTFLWSFLWLRFLSFCIGHIGRFWLALGLGTAIAFILGNVAAPFILDPQLGPSRAFSSLDVGRMTLNFVRDLQSAAIFAAVLFAGYRMGI